MFAASGELGSTPREGEERGTVVVGRKNLASVADDERAAGWQLSRRKFKANARGLRKSLGAQFGRGWIYSQEDSAFMAAAIFRVDRKPPGLREPVVRFLKRYALLAPNMTLLSRHCLKAGDALANIDQSRDFRVESHTL